MSRSATLKQLGEAVPIIAPSMLKCDFGNLRREVALLESAAARVLHWDVMDGHFVPNLSYGALLIERVRELTAMTFDAHLMISDPAKYLDDFLKAGCDSITIHLEAVEDPIPVLERIREADAAAGLAFNPGTPVEAVEPFLSFCDLVLVMSVEPGFGGQKFIPSALEKLRRLRRLRPDGVLLSIDGGVGAATIRDCAAAGADVFVVGSAIFEAASYDEAIGELRDFAQQAKSSPVLEQ